MLLALFSKLLGKASLPAAFFFLTEYREKRCIGEGQKPTDRFARANLRAYRVIRGILSAILTKEAKMADSVDFLVKGIPNSLLTMFRGLCSINGKTEGEGVIDLIIEHIDKNFSGDKANFKKTVDDYRASKKKK
jgi:hypothetical protein